MKDIEGNEIESKRELTSCGGVTTNKNVVFLI